MRTTPSKRPTQSIRWLIPAKARAERRASTCRPMPSPWLLSIDPVAETHLTASAPLGRTGLAAQLSRIGKGQIDEFGHRGAGRARIACCDCFVDIDMVGHGISP